MTDKDLALTICRALIMILRAIAKRYDLSLHIPALDDTDKNML